MITGSILNQPLVAAMASMGHGDILLLCDAGYPIPNVAWRVDLAVCKDLPSLEQMLPLLVDNLVIEKAFMAGEAKKYNGTMYSFVRKTLKSYAVLELVPHDEMLLNMGKRAKVIVRSGAFNPWGNIALQSGVDVPQWFSGDGITVPDYYKERLR